MNDIYNYLFYDEKLSSSGMPTSDQLRSMANAGVQLVINLAPHDVPNATPQEEKVFAELGVQYVNIPVNWGTPDNEGLDKFMQLMDDNKDKKIHVHCEANFRASGFITLYRILRLGWKRDTAFEVMHTVWDEDAYPVWEMFIEAALARNQGEA